jgi:hypothetical protein
MSLLLLFNQSGVIVIGQSMVTIALLSTIVTDMELYAPMTARIYELSSINTKVAELSTMTTTIAETSIILQTIAQNSII